MSTSLSLPSQEVALALIVGLVLIMLVRFYSSTRRSNTVRRAAFDIGSGASKVLVADVDKTGMLVGDPLWEAEKPCAFKEDTQGTVDGSLSEEIRSKGMALITELAKKARKLGATEACGIATEVFRTSPNGLDFLSEVEKRTRVPISTLSQDAEARLGLATAEALCGGQLKFDAAWDSGGGSFQITARDPGAAVGDAAPIATASLRTYVGKLGTGPSFERLVVRVRELRYDAHRSGANINPVSARDAQKLVGVLIKEMPAPPEWLRGGHVVAIGAFNSIFAVTLRALRLFVVGGQAAANTVTRPGEEGLSGNGTLTIGEARAALVAVTGRTDAELADVAGHGPDAEGPHLVAPKVALLVAVASHLRLERISYRRSVGGCAGLMALGEFVPL